MEPVNFSSFSGAYFTSAIPDINISVASPAVKARIIMTCGGSQIYNEILWPVASQVTLTDLGSMLEPYAQRGLVTALSISVQLLNASNANVGSAQTASASILFSRCDVGIPALQFYTSHFLTILQGEKVTALGRRELLWYYGSDAASVTAEYDDGTTSSFSPTVESTGSAFTCINVSPGSFTATGKTLVAYTVTAGNRSQRFVMDLTAPDCAPILEFYNSFGVWELIYCTGIHKVSPDYKRSSTRIGGLRRNYKIEETRTFKADTGILTIPMANWADDLFRSDSIYVVNVINGEMTSRDGGKKVEITDSKSEYSNDDTELPRFTFSYQYVQRIHNVMQQDRVGRIFDNTFDHTFD